MLGKQKVEEPRQKPLAIWKSGKYLNLMKRYKT